LKQAATLMAVGGLDPGGQAGLAADLQVAWHLQARAMAVQTARTAQNNAQFVASWPTSDAELAQVLASLDLPTTGVVAKTGMLGSLANARRVLEFAQTHALPLVVDPVMASSSGGLLWRDDPDEVRLWLLAELLPRAICVTPNWPELAWLSGRAITTLVQAEAAQRALPCPSVLKGGHAPVAEQGVDRLWDGRILHVLPPDPGWPGPRRGTGCRFASALAIELARGHTLPHAAATAKRAVRTLALQSPVS
jgi:hydroxymethylpyrimidine/phosphomethylpyrimidine kinase